MDPQRYYRIDLPKQAKGSYSPRLSIEVVTVDSAMVLRRHVERFAHYFLREMHTGGVQFEAAETINSRGYVQYRAYLFGIEDRYIGAGCFRYRDREDPALPWVFDWMWLHPYFRRRGHLTYAWRRLRNEIGDFRLARPLSPAMKAFMQKINGEERGDTEAEN